MEPDIIATSSPHVAGGPGRNDLADGHLKGPLSEGLAAPSVAADPSARRLPGPAPRGNGFAGTRGQAPSYSNGHAMADAEVVAPAGPHPLLSWAAGAGPYDAAAAEGHLGGLALAGDLPAGAGFYRLHGKRLLDLAGALAGLVLSAPLILLAAIAIRLESRGPVFYRSTRIGRGGRPFTFYKLRSMVKGADRHRHHLSHLNECDGPVFKMSRDPRVTAVGRFLRTTSLDELPQLWNVVRGDMSLVGPRPPIPEEVAHYQPWQMRRLDVKPGLTCLWQVSGRSRIGFEEWMRLDLEYIRRQSLALDLQILMRTIPAVLSREGAY